MITENLGCMKSGIKRYPKLCIIRELMEIEIYGPVLQALSMRISAPKSTFSCLRLLEYFLTGSKCYTPHHKRKDLAYDCFSDRYIEWQQRGSSTECGVGSGRLARSCSIDNVVTVSATVSRARRSTGHVVNAILSPNSKQSLKRKQALLARHSFNKISRNSFHRAQRSPGAVERTLAVEVQVLLVNSTRHESVAMTVTRISVLPFWQAGLHAAV